MIVDRPPIGILVKRFPKLSETFILSEILALEAMGWPVTIFTLAEPSDTIVHPDVAKVRAQIVQLDVADPVRDLANKAQRKGLAHIHAHFAGDPAAIARAAAERMGIGYSISAHAKDIYLTDDDLLRQNMQSARFIITCTSANAQHLRKVAPGVPVSKLYHGINCAKLKPSDPPKRTDPPVILSVGRLRAKKGLDLLIDACARLRDQDVAFRCEIVGYGPEEDALERQIAVFGLDQHITLVGKLGHDDVLDRMRAASIFALPCRIDADGDRDGVPNVILEAMAMGLPVVSTPVSGVPEIVTDGETGWLVEANNAEALAERLATLIRDGAPASVVSAARTAVDARFGQGRDMIMLDRLLNLATAAKPRAIGYVLKGFPRLSESFISSEVLRLEKLGKPIAVFALARGDEMAEPVLAEMTSPLAYLPSAGSVRKTNLSGWLRNVLPTYAPIHWWLFRKRPRAWISTLRLAFSFARAYRHRTDRCAKRSYFKQFLQAGAIAEALSRAGVSHLHGHFCHNATTITWLAAKLAGVSFSFTAHAKDIYQERHNPGDLLHRKVAAATFVTTCTAANHAHISERIGAAERVHTIYHGLDITTFAPSDRPGRDRLQLLAVGRHVEKKGFDLLIEALGELRDRGLNVECRLVGENGPVTAALAARIEAEGLSDMIRMDPPEPHSRLRQSYADADIFVLPCRIDDSGDRDGIPNVLAEAMATGLAVVSTNVSGIPEIVRDGENGLLVPPNSVYALADAIAALILDADLRRKLGSAASATIKDIFDADRTILDMDRLFDTVLEPVR